MTKYTPELNRLLRRSILIEDILKTVRKELLRMGEDELKQMYRKLKKQATVKESTQCR